MLAWRGGLTDDELVELTESHGGQPETGWWERVRPHSLGWVTARAVDGVLVGFVNVAWDGGDHAFLLDTKTRGSWQRHGVATRVVALAAERARAAGCEWLHVDWDPGLAPFYVDACGFEPCEAGCAACTERLAAAGGRSEASAAARARRAAARGSGELPRSRRRGSGPCPWPA